MYYLYTQPYAPMSQLQLTLGIACKWTNPISNQKATLIFHFQAHKIYTYSSVHLIP